MSLSLNEVEALAKRAARGAGYPWGLAEEAAKATRWLCAQGIDGCAELAALLTRTDGADLADWTPDAGPGGTGWRARGGQLCPLITGAALSDRADSLGRGDLQIASLVRPLLLLPFAALCAWHLRVPVHISWGAAKAATDGQSLALHGLANDGFAQELTVSAGGAMTQPNRTGSRADPRAEIRATLNRFAGRTFAPASEESRRKGAGAGLSDND
ncbi:DUF3726 domain-containing protein [Sedimentitalea sp. HM32M-2]|uniref:DUF3726 domain-containing protein n=1 Tax=Sedimentitalea sp. HM32M-2 TaxID=3351566 RepID=UPI00362AF818